MNHCYRMIVLMCISLFIQGHSYSFAYDSNVVHPKINENAVLNSGLDMFMRNQLGFQEGIDKIFGTKTSLEWFQEGVG